LGYKELFLTYINNDWGVGLAEVFKEQFLKDGGRLIDEFAYDEGKTDYRSEILRIKKNSPKAVVNLTYIKEGATMLKQAYETSLNVQWIMGVMSSFLCKIFLSQFLKEWQIVTHFCYRV